MVNPFAYSDSTISSTSVSRRCRFFTICGSNVPSRSRGTSISTSPAASEITVFDREPLRTFVDSRPGSAWFFSCPRCSVISSFSAVSSTFLVNSFNSPSGPVSSSPRAFASATIAAAAACSGDSCRAGLVVTLAWTHKVRCHHSQCPSRRTSARRVGPETPILKQSPARRTKGVPRCIQCIKGVLRCAQCTKGVLRCVQCTEGVLWCMVRTGG